MVLLSCHQGARLLDSGRPRVPEEHDYEVHDVFRPEDDFPYYVHCTYPQRGLGETDFEGLRGEVLIRPAEDRGLASLFSYLQCLCVFGQGTALLLAEVSDQGEIVYLNYLLDEVGHRCCCRRVLAVLLLGRPDPSVGAVPTACAFPAVPPHAAGGGP